MSKPWPMVPLGEVLIERKEVPSSGDIETGAVRIISKIGFNDGRIELRSGSETKTGMILVLPGDLVVSGINAAKGAIAIYEEYAEPIAATIHYGAYTPNKGRVNTRFLWWLLRSRTFRDILTEYVPGGIKTELKAKRLLPIPVPLPLLSEQNQIVERIEELAAKVEEARGLRREAVEEVSIFLRNSASSIFEKLVESYPLRTLGELVTVKGGGTPSKANPFYWNGSIPWISPKDMKSRELRDSIDHISEEAIANSAVKLIEPGAVLVVIRGMILVHTFPSATLRATATINQDMKALIPCSALLPEFLNCMFWAYNSRILKLVEKSTHDTRRLDISKLLALNIGLPPLSEQRRIVAYLDGLQAKVDELKRLQTETSVELDAMLPSILDRAFKGGWRTRESLSHVASVIRKQELETTLEESGEVPMAEFPEIYPATDMDRAICAAALSIVEQHGTLSSRDHRDALLLAAHPDWCKQLLEQKRHRSLSSAMKSAPKKLFLHKGQPIRWKECRDYLERLGAITIARGSRDQFIHPGTAFASVKACLPACTDGMVKYALVAIERVRELRNNLESVPPDERKVLQALDQHHWQNKIPA